MACLRSYLERTANVWSSLNNSGVFIGSNKPQNPVTGSTIGRWMKDQLKEAGIDTSIFSARSTFSQRNFLHFLATNPSRGLNNLGPKTKLISPRVVFLLKRKNFFVYASRHFSSLNLVVKKTPTAWVVIFSRSVLVLLSHSFSLILLSIILLFQPF